MLVRVCVFVCACMRLFVRVCVFVHVCVHALCACVRACMHTYVRAHVFVHACAHVRVCARVFARACICACVLACVRKDVSMRLGTHHLLELRKLRAQRVDQCCLGGAVLDFIYCLHFIFVHGHVLKHVIRHARSRHVLRHASRRSLIHELKTCAQDMCRPRKGGPSTHLFRHVYGTCT